MLLHLDNTRCNCQHCAEIRAITMISQDHLAALRFAIDLIEGLSLAATRLMLNKLIGKI